MPPNTLRRFLSYMRPALRTVNPLSFRSVCKRILALLMCLCCLVLTGCSGGNYARRTDNSRTLYIGVVGSSFPVSYMPWFSRDGIAPTISSMVFSTLLSYDEETASYEPALASEWCYVDREGNPIVTADGQVDYDKLESVYSGRDTQCIPIRFKLDENAAWSDGTRVTVEDIYFTFDLAANQKLSNHAGALAWVNDLLHKYDTNTGKLRRQGIYTYDTGANEKGYYIAEEDRDTVFYLETNKVLGAITPLVSTVLILPKHQYADIISLESPLYSTSPSDELRHAYENPIGCGPWVLDTEKTSGQEIVLRRREDYHIKAADGSELYKADALYFILYQDVNVAIYALKKGHLDALDSSISANYAGLFTDEEDIALFSAPGTYAQCLVLNMNPTEDRMTEARRMLTNADFRRAIALAVNQDEMIRNVLGGRGQAMPSGLILPSNKELYNPEANIIAGTAQERLAEANAILDELYPEKDKEGYRLCGGKRLSFEVLGSPGEQEAISFLQVLLQKVGIEIKYAAKGNSPETTYLYGGNFDMTIQGVVFSAGNVDIMFNSHFVSLTRSSNYGRLNNKELNQTINKMRTTLNQNTKYDLVKEISAVIAQQYYKLPLYVSDTLSIARTDRCQGWVVSEGATAFNMDSLENLTWVNH